MRAPLTPKTAILVFALSAKEEITHKNIGGGQQLFQSLTKHTVKLVEKTGLPFFLVNEKEQIGNTFGERFTNAIKAVLDKGFEQIITIGNDSPHLKSWQILETSRTILKNKVVLGPTTDGGFYLMGLHESNFEVKNFIDLEWQGAKLFTQLSERLTSRGIELVRLNPLNDIDDFKDIKRVLKYSSELSVELVRVLAVVLGIQKKIFNLPKVYSNLMGLNQFHNRGSPSLLIISQTVIS